jgi:hypothetical protein
MSAVVPAATRMGPRCGTTSRAGVDVTKRTTAPRFAPEASTVRWTKLMIERTPSSRLANDSCVYLTPLASV